jgi:hypothetical protein
MIWPVTEKQQRAELAKTWRIFHVGQDDPIHIRAIWGKGVPNPKPLRNVTFNSLEYPSVADRQRAFEEKVIELNYLGFNVYTCFNPISPRFGGDLQNGLAVKDSDILRRRFILIDVDRSDTSQPATDAEMDALCLVVGNIERDLFFDKGREPITVCSGNGAHIYLPVDLPNDATSKASVQMVLKALGKKYDTTAGQVDTSVFNTGRIAKVPGTIARKGVEVLDPNGDRYWRMVSVVS